MFRVRREANHPPQPPPEIGVHGQPAREAVRAHGPARRVVAVTARPGHHVRPPLRGRVAGFLVARGEEEDGRVRVFTVQRVAERKGGGGWMGEEAEEEPGITYILDVAPRHYAVHNARSNTQQ